MDVPIGSIVADTITKSGSFHVSPPVDVKPTEVVQASELSASSTSTPAVHASLSKVPLLGTIGSAGYDLCAERDVDFYSGETKAIESSNICMIPMNWMGEVIGRSSHEARQFHVLPSVVDYRRNGERLIIYATFSGEGTYLFRKGDRIAQLILSRRPLVTVELVDYFGDTGIAAHGKIRMFARGGGLILPHKCLRIPTWIKTVRIPISHYGRIISSIECALAGLFVVNGVIDSDYRGQIDIIILNLSSVAFCFTRHTKLAMLHILPCAHVELTGVATLATRGSGGFGSTGR